jgi:hypothetical protein
MNTTISEIPVIRKTQISKSKVMEAAPSSCCTPKTDAAVCCTPSKSEKENGGSCCAQPEDGSSCCDK